MSSMEERKVKRLEAEVERLLESNERLTADRVAMEKIVNDQRRNAHLVVDIAGRLSADVKWLRNQLKCATCGDSLIGKGRFACETCVEKEVAKRDRESGKKQGDDDGAGRGGRVKR